MNAALTFVPIVTGVMNFKPITRFESVIDAMAFIADSVMKWINVMIVVKSSVGDVAPY
jgi:predicted Kef-type K+ transport protein